VRKLCLGDLLRKGRQLSGVEIRPVLSEDQFGDIPLVSVQKKIKRAENLEEIPQRVGWNGLEIVLQLFFARARFADGNENTPGKVLVNRHGGHGAKHKLHVVRLDPKQAEKKERAGHIVAYALRVAEDRILFDHGKVGLKFAVVIKPLKDAAVIKAHRQAGQRGQRPRHIFVIKSHPESPESFSAII